MAKESKTARPVPTTKKNTEQATENENRYDRVPSGNDYPSPLEPPSDGTAQVIHNFLPDNGNMDASGNVFDLSAGYGSFKLEPPFIDLLAANPFPAYKRSTGLNVAHPAWDFRIVHFDAYCALALESLRQRNVRCAEHGNGFGIRIGKVYEVVRDMPFDSYSRKGETFKLSNTLRAPLARLLELEFVELDGMFTKRPSKCDPQFKAAADKLEVLITRKSVEDVRAIAEHPFNTKGGEQ